MNQTNGPLYIAEHYTGGLPHLLLQHDDKRAMCGKHYGPLTAFNDWLSVKQYFPTGEQEICSACLARTHKNAT